MVFQDEKVGKFINTYFISSKINGKEGEGPELKKKLSVPGYPTVIFMNSDGEELYRTLGFDGNKETYLLLLDYFASGIWKGTEDKKMNVLDMKSPYPLIANSLTDDLLKLTGDPDNVDLNFMLALKYTAQYEPDKAIPYFTKVVAIDPQNEKGYADEANYRMAVHAVRKDNDIEPLRSFLRKTSNRRFIESGYTTMASSYARLKDMNPEKAIELYEEALSQLPDDTDLLNEFAWFIHENQLKDHYGRGIELANKAVDLSPKNAYIWDTLAWLYYDKGDVKNARNAMNKAIKLQPDHEEFRKNLDKFQEKKTL